MPKGKGNGRRKKAGSVDQGQETQGRNDQAREPRVEEAQGQDDPVLSDPGLSEEEDPVSPTPTSDQSDDDSEPTVKELLKALASVMRTPTEQTFGRFGRVFIGQDTSLPVDGFLEALVSYQEQQAIKAEVALRQLPQVLGGAALTWWLTTGKTSPTWEEALAGLREAFGEVERDILLLEKLIETRQNPGQKVQSYVAEMLAINGRRRHPVSERVLVELAFLGLRPSLQQRIKIDHVNTMAVFRTKASMAEVDFAHAQRFKGEASQRKKTQVHEGREERKGTPGAKSPLGGGLDSPETFRHE